MMDIILTIVQLNEERYQTYVKEIEQSNLSKIIQGELKDLLQTARQHTVQATENGWI